MDEDATVELPDTVEEAENEIGGPQSLNDVDPQRNCEKRASVMKSIPKYLRGPFKNALKLALVKATAGDDVLGWKLVLMLPRMLLHRRPGGGIIAKSSLVARFELFTRGQWDQLIRANEECDERSARSRQRQSRRGRRNDLEARAEMLVQMGELSSARQALEGATHCHTICSCTSLSEGSSWIMRSS